MFASVVRVVPKSNCLRQDLTKIVVKNISAAYSTGSSQENQLNFETLAVSNPSPYVYHVELNRPKKMNAINTPMWSEIGQCFESLSENPDCRAIVLSGNGKLFCAGIDLSSMMEMGSVLSEGLDVARKCKLILPKIKKYQDSLTSLEKCTKPVIAAIHSACIGAGVDMITAADIRYCSKDAWFQVKEIDIGMAADVGTLQRLPKVIGSESLVRELCLSGRKMESDEALQSGLVSRVCNDKDNLLNESLKMAALIASKSPVAVQGTKRSIVYARDHTVQEGLDQIALWNQTMLQSEDLMQAVIAQMSKDTEPVPFAKL